MAASAEVTNNLIGLAPIWHPYFDRDDVNLESHQLLWTDIQLSELEDEETILCTLSKFRRLVRYTKAFDAWKCCLNHIKKCPSTVTFLVCSPRYALDIVPKLWPFKTTNVWRVYIYSENEVFDVERFRFYDESKKVFSVHKNLANLLEKIGQDLREYFIHQKAGIFSDQNPALHISVDDQYDLWWSSLIKALISLPYPPDYHHRLVDELKKHGFQDSIIDEFMSDFPRTKRAVWWYSRSGLFYGILNQAFRQRNIKVIVLFGSFLQDLYQELQTEQRRIQQESRTTTAIRKVYRGQVLSERDVEKLAASCSIQTVSLFSTTNDHSLAQGFLAASGGVQSLECVLFEIEIDYQQPVAVFADITSLSFYPEEKETLLMVNTTFLVESCEEHHDLTGLPPHWLVKLKLHPYGKRLLEPPLQAGSKRKTVKNCVNALSDMSEWTSKPADIVVFDILMDAYPEEATWMQAVKLHALAQLETQRCGDPRQEELDFSSAIALYQQAITKWTEHLENGDELNCSFDLAENYRAIARIHERVSPHSPDRYASYYTKAVSFYELALQKCSTEDYGFVEMLGSLRSICRDLASMGVDGYGLKAVTYQEHWIYLLTHNIISMQSESLADDYENLASRYLTIGRYKDALAHYGKALEIRRSANVDANSLSRMMNLCRDIAVVYTQHVHDFDSALHYELLRHRCCLDELGRRDAGVGQLHLKPLEESHYSVAECYLKTGQYVRGYKHLLEGLAYTRERKEMMLQEGHLVIEEGRVAFASDGQMLREPYLPDDEVIASFDNKIEEMEQKLKHVETLLEC